MKKSLITIVIIIILAFAGWYLWKSGYLGSTGIIPSSTSTDGTVVTPQTGDTTAGQTGISKITDDIYIEMMVKIVGIQAEKNPATYATEIASLYKKYNITEESMAAFAKELEKDPARAQAFAQKYAQAMAGASH